VRLWLLLLGPGHLSRPRSCEMGISERLGRYGLLRGTERDERRARRDEMMVVGDRDSLAPTLNTTNPMASTSDSGDETTVNALLVGTVDAAEEAIAAPSPNDTQVQVRLRHHHHPLSP
jgi:hypothetical protein